MEDTPEHIKKLQLEIWLAKPPGERLRLAIKSNEELHAFWNAGKKISRLRSRRLVGKMKKNKTPADYSFQPNPFNSHNHFLNFSYKA